MSPFGVSCQFTELAKQRNSCKEGNNLSGLKLSIIDAPTMILERYKLDPPHHTSNSMTLESAHTCNRPSWTTGKFAPTIYTSPGRRGVKTFIGNFSYPDTAWSEQIIDTIGGGDIQTYREIVADDVRELQRTSLGSVDLDRAIAGTAIEVAAESVPTIRLYPITHIALSRPDFLTLKRETKRLQVVNPVEVAEGIPGISELPTTIFYSGTDVHRALRAFERSQQLDASIFVDGLSDRDSISEEE